MKQDMPSGATLTSAKAVTINKKTAYRADLTLPVVTPAGTTIAIHNAELYLLTRGSTDNGDATVIDVSVIDSPAGTRTIDSILGSVHHI
jgi:hypothetical protein